MQIAQAHPKQEAQAADAEIVACTFAAFAALGFADVRMQLNDRQVLVENLEPFATAGVDVFSIIRSVDKLDKISESEVLDELEIPHECRIVSAHRTPEVMADYARTARERGLKVIIAGAGGAAHLPGMLAAQTLIPVLGVPVQSRALSGLDSLLSIVQMPAGVPVGTLAIGSAGARNAALLAAQMLATERPELHDRLAERRAAIARTVTEDTLP